MNGQPTKGGRGVNSVFTPAQTMAKESTTEVDPITTQGVSMRFGVGTFCRLTAMMKSEPFPTAKQK